MPTSPESSKQGLICRVDGKLLCRVSGKRARRFSAGIREKQSLSSRIAAAARSPVE